MERDSFVIYASWIEAIRKMPNDIQLHMFYVMFDYIIYGTIPSDLSTSEDMMFGLIKPQIDVNNKKYVDGCKGGRPKKNWENSQKPLVFEKKTTGYENGKPNVYDNENVNENENENVNGGNGSTTVVVSPGLDEIDTKKNSKKVKEEKFKETLLKYDLDISVVDLAIVYNSCKKGKKLSDFKEPQLKIRVDKLKKCGFNSIEGMKQVLENSIAGGYEGIFELKQNQIQQIQIQQNDKDKYNKVVNVGGTNYFLP